MNENLNTIPENNIPENLRPTGTPVSGDTAENSSLYTKSKSRFPWIYAGLAVLVIASLVLHFLVISRPPTIVWDETWYVGDARSIISGTGDLRIEHPALSKLFIVAGSYLFSGFKPEVDSGAHITGAMRADTNDTYLFVSDAAVFSPLQPGKTIRIESEQIRINGIDENLNRLTVQRGVDGTDAASHSSDQEIYLYRDSATGWRFFSVIFGTACIPVFFFISRRLKMSAKVALLATFLFALDDMYFVHSSLALLDIYMLFFMLLGILFYLQKGYLLSGITFAISALCKTTGVVGLLVVMIHWLFFRKDEQKSMLKLLNMIGCALAALVAYLSLDILFEYIIQGKLVDPITRTIEMLKSNAANIFTDPPLSISSRPWEWLYPWKIIVYAYGAAPEPQYISFISWTIQLLIVPIFGYLIYKAVKHNTAARFALIWFIASYIIWIPLDIITNRVTYVFYFLPTTGAVCTGIALAVTDIIYKLKDRTVRYGRVTKGTRAVYAGIGLYLLLHLAIFVIFNPNFPTIFKFWLPPFLTPGS